MLRERVRGKGEGGAVRGMLGEGVYGARVRSKGGGER